MNVLQLVVAGLSSGISHFKVKRIKAAQARQRRAFSFRKRETNEIRRDDVCCCSSIKRGLLWAESKQVAFNCERRNIAVTRSINLLLQVQLKIDRRAEDLAFTG